LGSSAYILGLGTLAFSLTTGTIAGVTALLVGVFYIKFVEEKELRARFGNAYDDYCRQTPFLLPLGNLFGPSKARAADANRPQGSEENAESLPDSLPTKGRVLVKAALVYDQVQPFVTLGQEARMNRWIAERIRPPDGARVLDVGCGTGLLTVQIAEGAPGCFVEGIDASGPMIRVARQKRTRPNCTFRQALAEELPYPNEHFDLVTSALFFHHVDRELKRRCLTEIYRTLKPGGLLVIADMDKPYTIMGWLLSYGAWLLFRQPEIKENLDGVLREEVGQSGFDAIEDRGQFSGYIRVFSARRPE
jgi:ubiquinone/menaquinone biosynthesis C-methylase UbiE